MIRLPAHDIEVLVVQQLSDWLEVEPAATDTSEVDALDAVRLRRAELAHALREGNQLAQRAILLELGVTIGVGDMQVNIHVAATNDFACATTIEVPATRIDRGSDLRLAIAGDGGSVDAKPDPILLKLIVLAFAAREAALTGKPEPLVDHYSRQHRTRLARLSYLAPDVVAAIVDGRQPPALNGRRLLRIADLPLDWRAQRQLLGFA